MKSGLRDVVMELWGCNTEGGGAVGQIWDLESKSIVDELRPDFMPAGKKAQVPHCTCLNWSADGATLYSGYTDGKIRVWGVGRAL